MPNKRQKSKPTVQPSKGAPKAPPTKQPLQFSGPFPEPVVQGNLKPTVQLEKLSAERLEVAAKMGLSKEDLARQLASHADAGPGTQDPSNAPTGSNATAQPVSNATPAAPVSNFCDRNYWRNCRENVSHNLSVDSTPFAQPYVIPRPLPRP